VPGFDFTSDQSSTRLGAAPPTVGTGPTSAILVVSYSHVAARIFRATLVDLRRCLTAARPGKQGLVADPDHPSFGRHGNPNVLTADLPSSQLSQGTAAQHALVEVGRWRGPGPPITVDKPPTLS